MNRTKIAYGMLALITMGAATLPISASEIRFIPATPANTTLADGSPLNLEDGDWIWLPAEGNGGIFESHGDPKKNAPGLIVHAKDLEPNSDYEVFGFFWTHGFGAAPATRGKQPHHWPARFGLALADLRVFGGKHSPEIPWIICPGSAIAAAREHNVVLEEKEPLIQGVTEWITAKEDLRLIRARLGISRANKDGSLPVYADDFPDSTYCGITRISGIAVRTAPDGSIATAGIGDAKDLHFALRARDKLSVARELAAGANPNTLDSSGLSTLYHPASTGDQDMVKLLLSAGADPNVKGQSVLALTAAASIGDEAMVRLLLNAGAEVPSGKLEPAPTMNKRLDQSHLHPAIAAIRIGSLATLKALLGKKPDLNLETLATETNDANDRPTSKFLIDDAMVRGHDELAAFLIDRGCTLRSDKLRSGELQPDVDLLVRSITEGTALARSREALLKRGVPITRSKRFDGGILKPWDAVSAAVCVGDVSLTKRFLAMASIPYPEDQSALLALARWGGDSEIIRLIEEAFPNTKLEWQPKAPEGTSPRDEASLRLLLPRTKPATAPKAEINGDWTLAVIPAPDEGGQSALLEVAASKQPGWKVVDRQEIHAALGEARFANPWGKGQHRLADLGDRVSADLLILVSRLEGQKIDLLRFEAVDVTTGLPVLREHVESKTLGNESAASALLLRIRSAFTRARTIKRPMAITMLPFSVGENVPNSLALSRLFDTAIHSEVDATPGTLTVGRDQIQAIANEQKLGGQEKMWAATFTLEGGISKIEDGKVSLTLRLRPLSGGANEGTDATESGSANEIVALTSRAWRKLASSGLLAGSTVAEAKPEEVQAKTEAARLLREGEWLLNAGSPEEALPLFERAELLGADPEKLVTAHLNALAKCIWLGGNEIELFPPYATVQIDPPSWCSQMLILQGLGNIRALLDHAAYYQTRYGTASIKWEAPFPSDKKANFLHAVTFLSYLRAAIPKVLPKGVSEEEVRAFGEDLDRFTAECFRLRAAMDRPSMVPGHHAFRFGPGSAAMLRRNPELLKGWITMYFVTSAGEIAGTNAPTGTLRKEFNVYTDILGEELDWCIYHWYGVRQLFVGEILKRMNEYHGPYRALRDAEIAYVLSTDDQHASAARKYAGEIGKLGRNARIMQGDWIGRDLVRRYGTSKLLDFGFPREPRNEDVLLASLAHEPLGNFDWIGHPGYEETITDLIFHERISAQQASKRLKAHDPKKHYDDLANAASKDSQGWQVIDSLLGGVRLWEDTYGYPLYDDLSGQWKRYYKNENKTGDGSGIAASLLVDLRKIDNSKPGIFKFPTIDNTRRDLIWLYYQSFEEKPTHRKDFPDSPPLYPRRHPWVLGIDCGNGKMSTAVDLALAPEFGPGTPDPESTGFFDEKGFIVQTKDLILTSAEWTGRKPDESAVREAAVMFRKSGGDLIPLEPSAVVRDTPDMVLRMNGAVGAVALGDEFFYLQFMNNMNPDHSTTDKAHFQLARIASTGKTTAVTAFSRRPQLTPFDPADLHPRMILREGKRLLVIHDWDHAGYFNPADGTWEMSGEKQVKRAAADHLVNTEYRSHIFPHSRIHVEGGNPELVVKFDVTFPDKLAVLVPGKGEARVQVRLEIPEGFSKQPVLSDRVFEKKKNTSHMIGCGTYGTRKDNEHYNIVVLNQTKSDLILGLRAGEGYGQTHTGLQWCPGKRLGGFLPLLWTLPKEKLVAAATKALDSSKQK